MIRVRLFSMLKEAAGTSEVEMPLPEGGRVESLVEVLTGRYPALGELFRERRVLVAVNQSYAGPDTEVADGDEVAFLPPVSGG
jgi:molybdopterin converting factor subunit 1